VDDVVVPRLVKAPPADLVDFEGFRAILHQGVRPHVVVRADDEGAERIHHSAVPVAAIAGSKQMSHQSFETGIAEPRIEIRQKRLLLGGTDVTELVVRAGLLEQREVLVLVRRTRVVEHDDAK
jgi:hypothetical protein